jgi:hypothetical protein
VSGAFENRLGVRSGKKEAKNSRKGLCSSFIEGRLNLSGKEEI